MSTFTTTPSTTVRSFLASLFALLLMAGTSLPAQAQMEDGELPEIDLSVNLAQHAQYISLDRDGTDPIAGFQRVRAGVTASVQFSENVSGLLMLQQEPNDFGFQSFFPAVDFAILDVALSDQLTLRTGTPVTGLMNFRGYSDGPVVQGNPLIGNSPADMITAGQGVKLIGSFDSFGFDVTINKGFGGTLTQPNGSNTGVNLIGKFRVTGSDAFKFGAGLATVTGSQPLVFSRGDGDSYDLAGAGVASPNTRAVHAQMPNETIFHADAKLTGGGADVDLWGGYATQSDGYGSGEDFQALFGGIGAKYNFSDTFHAAGRFTYAGDQSDAVSDFSSTSLTRIQLGIGVMVHEKAMWKLEFVNQSETGLAPADQEGTQLSGIGDNWTGVTTELSFNF